MSNNPWSTEDVDLAVVDHVVDKIRPILRGYPPEYQGFVCANLLAIWIASHRDGDDPTTPGPLAFRNQLIADALALIHQLIPLEDEWFTEQLKAGVKFK
jgi:hypothetical protein